MTIADKRRNAIQEMMKNFHIAPLAARSLMNRYYKLYADKEKLNHSKNEKLNVSVYKRGKKLNEDLKKYGLKLVYENHLPMICSEDNKIAVSTYFYHIISFG